MSGRTFAIVLVLALIVPAAAQGDPAHVEAPIEASEVQLTAGAATIAVEEDNGSMAASARSGSLVVWEQRTPCFSQGSCLEDRSETSRTSSTLEASSLTIEPRDEGVHRTVLELSDGRFSLGAGDAQLAIRPEAETVDLAEGGEPPEDIREAELPRGLDARVDEADATLEGQLEFRTTSSVVRVETDGSQAREIVTGVSWEEADDGFEYRVLRLAKASFAGGLTTAWDGTLQASPRLPTSLTAGSAEVDVTRGQLAEAGEDAGTVTLEDLEATVTGVEWRDDAPARFLVQHGQEPVAASQTPDEEGVSRTTLIGAGSAAVAAALVTAYYWPRVSWLGTALVLPLYSRIEKDELFENETREELYESIQADPGIHAHALSEAVDIGWGTTVYHLRRLERNGFVHSEKRGRYRRFFPASGFVERQREVLSVLQNETTSDIATLVREQPGLNQSAICEELDISPSLANWHLNRLIDAELVDRERRGRTVHYSPGEAWEAIESAPDLESGPLGDAQAA